MFLFSFVGNFVWFQGPGAKKEEVKEEKKEEKKEPEGPKFQAFTGRKYSLRDWGYVCLVSTCEIIDGVNIAFYRFEAKASFTEISGGFLNWYILWYLM